MTYSQLNFKAFSTSNQTVKLETKNYNFREMKKKKRLLIFSKRKKKRTNYDTCTLHLPSPHLLPPFGGVNDCLAPFHIHIQWKNYLLASRK